MSHAERGQLLVPGARLALPPSNFLLYVKRLSHLHLKKMTHASAPKPRHRFYSLAGSKTVLEELAKRGVVIDKNMPIPIINLRIHAEMTATTRV